MVAVPIGLLAASGVVAWFVAQPPRFRSDAVFQIQRDVPFIAFPTQGGRSDRFAATQLALIRTRSVLEPAWESIVNAGVLPVENIPVEPMEWLNDNLKHRISHSELVTLTFQAPDAKLAQTSLQGILDSFLDYTQSLEHTSDDRVIELLSEERDSRQAVVEQTRKQVREEVQASGVLVGDDDLTGFLGDASFNAMEQMLIRTEVDLEVLSAKYTAEQERVASGEAKLATEHQLQEFIDSTPEVAAIKTSIREAEDRLDTYLTRLTNAQNSPLVQKTRKEIRDLNRELADVQRRVRVRAEDEFKQLTEATNEERLEQLKNDVAAKTAVRNRLVQRLDEERKRVTGDAIDVEFVRDELARQEDIYDRISSRIVALQTERRAPERIEVVDPPHLPAKPVPADLKKPLVATLAALLLPFVFCAVLERLYERVSSSDSLESDAGVMVFGETARLPAHVGIQEPKRLGQLMPYRESVGSIGSLLQLSRPNGSRSQSQVIGVLSSVANEGKTHLATHLAAYLGGRDDSRTLLIEADFRAPTIRRLLGLARCPGLTQVLNGDAKIEDAICGAGLHAFGQMDLMMVGSDSLQCLPLDREKLSDIVDQLRDRYDYIVFDTSPILSTNEALPIAMTADENLLCVMKGESRLTQIRHSISQLKKVDANLLGIVVNGVDTRSYYSRYGRYDTHVEVS